VGEVYSTERPRKRRGRGLLITLIVLLVIAGVVLFMGDRFGRSYAEQTIADKVADQVTAQKATSGDPQVTIEGFPFLTQVVRGSYHEIKIKLPDFTGPAGNGKTLKMSALDISAQDVKAPLGTIRTGKGDIVASTVTGTGTIPYGEIAKLIDQPDVKLSQSNGQIVATGPVQALGKTFQVTATAKIQVVAGKVSVKFSDVTAAGLPNLPIVKNLISAYANQLGLDLEVPALPLHLALQQVRADPDGLKVTANAHNVKFNGNGL
jgi:hypothetical protein